MKCWLVQTDVDNFLFSSNYKANKKIKELKDLKKQVEKFEEEMEVLENYILFFEDVEDYRLDSNNNIIKAYTNRQDDIVEIDDVLWDVLCYPKEILEYCFDYCAYKKIKRKHIHSNQSIKEVELQ